MDSALSSPQAVADALRSVDYLPDDRIAQVAYLAATLGKPVLVMRDKTERPEGVDAGNARLVGSARDEIRQAVAILLEDDAAYDRMARARNPYGDGRASARISAILCGESPEPYRV